MNKKSDQAVLKFEVAEIVKLSVNSTGKKLFFLKKWSACVISCQHHEISLCFAETTPCFI